jgi:hypothetical protein
MKEGKSQTFKAEQHHGIAFTIQKYFYNCLILSYL